MAWSNDNLFRHETTWNKVHVIAAVHELGFNVIHSDTDVTWFQASAKIRLKVSILVCPPTSLTTTLQDPMPFFSKYSNGPAHVLFSTDALDTRNEGANDQGLEAGTGPHININTGVYFIRQFDGAKRFFNKWLEQKAEGPVQNRGIGHDQDGLNLMVRWEGGHRSQPFILFIQIRP